MCLRMNLDHKRVQYPFVDILSSSRNFIGFDHARLLNMSHNLIIGILIFIMLKFEMNLAYESVSKLKIQSMQNSLSNSILHESLMYVLHFQDVNINNTSIHNMHSFRNLMI